jgi:hypothetical protein
VVRSGEDVIDAVRLGTRSNCPMPDQV